MHIALIKAYKSSKIYGTRKNNRHLYLHWISLSLQRSISPNSTAKTSKWKKEKKESDQEREKKLLPFCGSE